MNALFPHAKGYRNAMLIDNVSFTLKCLELRRMEIDPVFRRECFKIINFYCHILLFYYLR